MKLRAMMLVTAMLLCGGALSQTLYKCGRTYQDRPCDDGKGRSMGAATSSLGVTSGPTDAECVQRGQDSLKIVWAREGGATEERMLAEAPTPAQRRLVQEVYRERGSASQIQSAIATGCIAQKQQIERDAALAAAAAPTVRSGSARDITRTSKPCARRSGPAAARRRWIASRNRAGGSRPRRAERAASGSARQVLGVEAEGPALAVGEPALERQADRAEGDLLPRDRRLLDEGHFQRFLAGLELEVAQPGAVEEVHLVHPRHRDQRERLAELDDGARLLERLAKRRLRRGLVVLHEAGRQRPVAVARLDRAAAEKQAPLVLRDRADDQLRVLVVDLAAVVAHPARQRVAGRHALHDRRAAVSAELHPPVRRAISPARRA